MTINQSQYNYKVGGSLSFNHPTYVKRSADKNLLNALEQGKFCYVFNCRQMGKSSLRVQAMHQLQEKRMACTSVDISSLGSDISQSQWYGGLISQLFLGLNLVGKINLKAWLKEREEVSPIQKLRDFLEEVILEYCFQEKIFIFIDEIDKVLSLPFSSDDFFTLIRYCYNQRAEDERYYRLTFALFGVATPSDLIRDKTQTPFNIGTAIELTGFTLSETEPLEQGLFSLLDHPKRVLQEILYWTGGQPFLTQKVCDLLLSHKQNILPNDEKKFIEKMIQKNIINHWESQDEPVHLRTIRDRLFRLEQKAGRLLGIYQHILQEGFIKADDSPEQTELRLSGLVVKQQDNLVPYNQIYQSVFNLNWVNQQLEKIRPYSEAIDAWIASNCQDRSRLLRGNALQDALFWSKDKNLSSVDYRFLNDSQTLERRDIDQSNEILAEANRKAKRFIRISYILGISFLLLSLVSFFGAERKARISQRGTEIQTEANNSLENFQFNQINSLISALQAGNDLKSLVSPDLTLEDYPTTTPILALQQILNNIKLRNNIEAHQDTITAISLRPDGQIFATTAWDGSVKLWHQQGRLQGILTQTPNLLYDVTFSPTGQTLAIASDDGTAKLYDLSGKLLRTFKGHQKAVYRLSFSPDAQLLATASQDQTARIWNLAGETIALLQGHTKSVDDAVFSADGKQIATASRDGTARLWDLNGKLLATFSANNTPLYSVALHPNGEKIAAAAKDGTVKVWTIRTKQLQTLQGHQKSVFRVRFSADGNYLVSASSDGTARIWDNKGHAVAILSVSQEPVSDVVIREQQVFTVSQDGLVKQWDLGTPSQNEVSTVNRRVTDGTMNAAQGMIAMATEGGNLSLWDEKGQFLRQWETDHSWIYDLRFSQEGKILASAAGDGITQLWDLKGREIAKFAGNGSRVYGVDMSPDGQLLAIAAKDGKVWIENIQSQQTLQVINAHDDRVYGVAFDPKGARIATVSQDKTGKIWDLQGNLQTELSGHDDIVTQVQFSPDGQLVLTASRDGTAKLWDLEGKLVKTLQGDLFPVSSIQFSPDGQQIATGSSDGTTRLWDIKGNLRGEYKDKDKEIIDIAFRPHGQQMMTINSNGTIKRWPVEGEYEHLTELLQQGCNWLQDYLVTHPEKQEILPFCGKLGVSQP